MALHFRSNNLLHTLGSDFQYANARMFYKNMVKVMNYVNDRPEYGVNVVFATPSDYINAIHKE
mgnify:CR=1 FL=1